MDQTKHRARIAGLLYLVVGIFGGFSQGYFQPLLYAAGDPAATAAQITAHAGLVPWGVLADLTNAVAFLFLVLVLYPLLRASGETTARIMVGLVTVAVAVMSLNNVFEYGAFRVMTDPGLVTAFGATGQAALAYLMLDLQHTGGLVAQVFFGLWLIPLGLLGWWSGRFPKWLGGLLIAGGVCYLVNLVTLFLVPGFGLAIKPFIVIPSGVAEIVTVFYLLIVGVRVPKPL